MRRDSTIKWQMSEEEQLTQKLRWSLQVIRDGEKVMRQVIEKLGFQKS